MNTMYAKSKIEKLMAVANHPNTNENEAQSAYNMAKKVAEKYKVLTWFFLTYDNSVVKNKVDQYILNDRYRWVDLTNTIYDLFFAEFDIQGYTLISRKSNYYANIILNGTEKQVEFLDEVYKILLKAKNQFKKGFKSKGIDCHHFFTCIVVNGFHGDPIEKDNELIAKAYDTGKLIRDMYDKKSGMGW